MVADEPFDLILLGANMACMDNFYLLDALRRLQETTGTVAPAVVILTTSEHDLDKARAAQYPTKGYLAKPLTQGQVNYLIVLIAEGAE